MQSNPDDLKKKKRQVEQDIERAEDDLHSSSARMQQASAALATAREQLGAAKVALAAAEAKVATAAERDAQMQAELDEATLALEQAQAELESSRVDRAAQRDQVATTITDIYQQGDPELLAFASLLDAKTPADLTRQTKMRDAIVDRESRTYQELQASEVLLEVREAQVAAAKEVVATKRAAAAAHLAEMQEYEAEAASAQAAVAARVGERRTAHLAAAQARRPTRRRSLPWSVRRRRSPRSSAGSRRRPCARSGPSRRSRGRRPGRPVASSPRRSPTLRLSSPFGWRTHPIYGYWGLHDGQDWAADCGQPLVAGADGRVVSSYYSSVYGNRLVIDHGAVAGRGLATVYNHASSYRVGVGARVSRGQVIGYVGNTGWSTGCHLHFSVMANGQTVDPRGWL